MGLGRSEERFQRFVLAHDRPGFGFDSPIGTLHDDPLDVIAGCLISDALRGRLREAGLNPFRFGWQLVGQIDPANELFKRDFDWSAAQTRVVDFLAARGETLPQSDESTDYERRVI